MGRTLHTANQLILEEQAAFANFRRALRREDQRAFDALFAAARKHTAAISQANHALPFEVVLLAMLLEQSRELERLQYLLAGDTITPGWDTDAIDERLNSGF